MWLPSSGEVGGVIPHNGCVRQREESVLAEKKTERTIVTVAYKGITDQFKLYVTPDGRSYVLTPSGKRAYVTQRRDGTYIVQEDV